jgi:23S rRNA C2498 (ribose-2'-O)-methylase RlmM
VYNQNYYNPSYPAFQVVESITIFLFVKYAHILSHDVCDIVVKILRQTKMTGFWILSVCSRHVVFVIEHDPPLKTKKKNATVQNVLNTFQMKA